MLIHLLELIYSLVNETVRLRGKNIRKMKNKHYNKHEQSTNTEYSNQNVGFAHDKEDKPN